MSRMPEPCGILTILSCWQRAGHLEALFAEDERGDADNREQHEQAEDGIADDDERMASAA